MIIVTGTKRSGTSLWMQILRAAGLPIIGEEYLGHWRDSIVDANPNGFFESKIRYGVNHQNNPNIKTGQYLHPKSVIIHGVKIFATGLFKTELAFIHRVIMTMRPWRSYCYSIRRLQNMESRYWLSLTNNEAGLSQEMKVILKKNTVHPALIWWRENNILLSDVSNRRYPARLYTFDDVLEKPDSIIADVLHWCMAPLRSDFFNVEAMSLNLLDAIQLVDPDMQTHHSNKVDDVPLSNEQIQVFDELYLHACNGFEGFSDQFVRKLNSMNQVIEELIEDQEVLGRQWKHRQLMELGCESSKASQLIGLAERKRKNRWDRPLAPRIEVFD